MNNFSTWAKIGIVWISAENKWYSEAIWNPNINLMNEISCSYQIHIWNLKIGVFTQCNPYMFDIIWVSLGFCRRKLSSTLSHHNQSFVLHYTMWIYKSILEIVVKAGTHIAFSPLGKLLACGGSDGLVRVYNDAGRLLQEFDNSGGGAVTALCWMGPGEKLIISGHANGLVAVVSGHLSIPALLNDWRSL